MRSDAVGACRDRDLRRLDRIGMLPATCIADSRHVIDVDAEAKVRNLRQLIGSFEIA
jgi:hypothetical protein